jgi:hypothetical protein
MNNASYPDNPKSKQSRSSIDNNTAECHRVRPFDFFQWWNTLTRPIELPNNAHFIKRDNYRKACLFSHITFFLLIMLCLFVPICLFLQIRHIIPIVSGQILVSCACLYLNRTGKTVTARVVQVISFEITLTCIILITTPTTNTSIQIFDILIIGELLAASLLSIRSMFLVILYNALFIWLNINYPPHTLATLVSIHSPFIPLLVHAIGLQFVIAGVSSIWVYNIRHAIRLADKTEMVALLEHTLTEQQKELESGIEQILQTHVQVANGNLNARVPLAQNHVLWHIARALNNLLTRLQRTSQAEKELHRVEQAVTATIMTMQNSNQRRQQTRIPFTQTAIDPLIATMQCQTYDCTWLSLQHDSRSTEPVNMRIINTKFPFRRPPQ